MNTIVFKNQSQHVPHALCTLTQSTLKDLSLEKLLNFIFYGDKFSSLDVYNDQTVTTVHHYMYSIQIVYVKCYVQSYLKLTANIFTGRPSV